MKAKVCAKCGKIFVPTSGRQKCCNSPLEVTCVVCGTKFMSKCTEYPATTCDNLECKKVGALYLPKPEKRICKQCGEEFVTSLRKQEYCGHEKKKVCPVCGQEFTYRCAKTIPATCSKPCADRYVIEQRQKSILNQTRICKFCGKEFIPKEWRDEYCQNKHYKKCAVCGKEFEVDPRTGVPETCSSDCMKQLMSKNHDYAKGVKTLKHNLLTKYGVTNAAQLESVKQKMKQTTLKKYGVECYTQTEEYKEKAKATNQAKYGTDHPSQSQQVKDKLAETNLKKYGTTCVFQSEEIKNKMKASNTEKYGVEHAMQNPEVKAKAERTNLIKYGFKAPTMNADVVRKAQETNLLKYGRRAITQQHINDIASWYRFIDDPAGYIASNYDSLPRTADLALDLGVDATTIDEYLKRNDAGSSVRRAKSLMEEELVKILHDADPDCKIECNSRSVIPPKEVDIYLPSYNLAIECNPTATHNSSVPDPWGGEPKLQSYHKQKTDMCEKVGVRLIHIFGYEWSHRKAAILSVVLNAIHANKSRIYARKCRIVEVGSAEARDFLDKNHRQGSAPSTIRIGLKLGDELVSLMTFGPMRKTIGCGNEDLSNCFELVRFCSEMNSNVVGGASKLFSHFIEDYSPERIRSFSDRAHTSGNLYLNLGFKEVRRSDPGYVWVNVETDIAYHRANAQKRNIKKFLKDDNIDLTKTEKEIMIEHGFVQVFDSGTITWEWIKNKAPE